MRAPVRAVPCWILVSKRGRVSVAYRDITDVELANDPCHGPPGYAIPGTRDEIEARVHRAVVYADGVHDCMEGVPCGVCDRLTAAVMLALGFAPKVTT